MQRSFQQIKQRLKLSRIAQSLFEKQQNIDQILDQIELPQLINTIVLGQLEYEIDLYKLMNLQLLGINYLLIATSVVTQNMVKTLPDRMKQLLRSIKKILTIFISKSSSAWKVFQKYQKYWESWNKERDYFTSNLKQYQFILEKRLKFIFVLIKKIYDGQQMGLLYVTYLQIFRRSLFSLFQDFIKKRLKYEFQKNDMRTTTLQWGYFNVIYMVIKMFVSWITKLKIKNQIKEQDLKKKWQQLSIFCRHFSVLQMQQVQSIGQLTNNDIYQKTLNRTNYKRLEDRTSMKQLYSQKAAELKAKYDSIRKTNYGKKVLEKVNQDLLSIQKFLKNVVDDDQIKQKEVNKNWLYLNRVKVYMNKLGFTFGNTVTQSEMDIDIALNLLKQIQSINYVKNTAKDDTQFGISVCLLGKQDLLIPKIAMRTFPQQIRNIQYFKNMSQSDLKQKLSSRSPQSKFFLNQKNVQSQQTLYLQMQSKLGFTFSYDIFVDQIADKIALSKIQVDYIRNEMKEYIHQNIKYLDADLISNLANLAYQSLLHILPKQMLTSEQALQKIIKVFFDYDIKNSKRTSVSALGYNFYFIAKNVIEQKIYQEQQKELPDDKVLQNLRAIKNQYYLNQGLLDHSWDEFEKQDYGLYKFKKKPGKNEDENLYIQSLQKQNQRLKQNKIKSNTPDPKIMDQYKKLKREKMEQQENEQQNKLNSQLLENILNYKGRSPKKENNIFFPPQHKDLFKKIFTNLLNDNDLPKTMEKFFKIINVPDEIMKFAQQKYDQALKNRDKTTLILKGNIQNKIKQHIFDNDMANLMVEYIYKIIKQTGLSKMLKSWTQLYETSNNQIQLIQINIKNLGVQLTRESDSGKRAGIANTIQQFKFQISRRERIKVYIQRKWNQIKNKINDFILKFYRSSDLNKETFEARNLSFKDPLRKMIYSKIVSNNDTIFRKQEQFNNLGNQFETSIKAEVKKINDYISNTTKQLKQIDDYSEIIEVNKTMDPVQLYEHAKNYYMISKNNQKIRKQQGQIYKTHFKCLVKNYVGNSAMLYQIILLVTKINQIISEKISGKKLKQKSLLKASLNHSIRLKDYLQKLYQKMMNVIEECGFGEYMKKQKSKLIQFYKQAIMEAVPEQNHRSKASLELLNYIQKQTKKVFQFK